MSRQYQTQQDLQLGDRRTKCVPSACRTDCCAGERSGPGDTRMMSQPAPANHLQPSDRKRPTTSQSGSDNVGDTGFGTGYTFCNGL